MQSEEFCPAPSIRPRQFTKRFGSSAGGHERSEWRLMTFGVHGIEKVAGGLCCGFFCRLRQCMNRLLMNRPKTSDQPHGLGPAHLALAVPVGYLQVLMKSDVP